MAIPRQPRVLDVECPACRATTTVLAHENPPKRWFFCPHCQWLWDTTERAHDERARLTRRPMKMQQEHEILTRKSGDNVERAEPPARHGMPLVDGRSRRRT